MAEQIYIFPGPFGTRSLEFQAFLSYNANLLARKNISFFHRQDNLSTLSYHGRIAQEVFTRPETSSKEDVWKTFLTEARESPSPVILCSDVFYQPSHIAEPFYQQLKKRLEHFSVKGIFYLRRADFWLETLYINNLYSGEASPITPWLEAQLRPDNYTNFLIPFQAFQKIFGPENTLLRLTPMENLSQFSMIKEIASDFLKLFHLEQTEEFSYPRVHEGPPIYGKSADFICLLNKHLSPEQLKNWTTRSDAFKKISQTLTPQPPKIGEISLFSPSQQNKILATVRPMYEKLREILPEDHPRTDFLFAPPATTESFTQAPPLSTEETLRTMMAIQSLLPVSLRHLH